MLTLTQEYWAVFRRPDMGIFPPPTVPFLMGQHYRDKHEDQPLPAPPSVWDLGHGSSLLCTSGSMPMRCSPWNLPHRNRMRMKWEDTCQALLWSWLSCRILELLMKSRDLYKVTGSNDKHIASVQQEMITTQAKHNGHVSHKTWRPHASLLYPLNEITVGNLPAHQKNR